MTDHEKFKNIAEGIQSIALTFAVIVGGIWTIWTFSILGSRQKAEAELFKQAVIDVEIEAKQETVPNDPNYYVAINVKVTNKGSRNTLFSYSGSSLIVSKVSFDQTGAGIGAEKIIEVQPDAQEVVLRTGSTISRPLFARVRERGFYYLCFRAPVSEPDMQVYTQTGGGGTKTTWNGCGEVLVR